MKRNLICPLPWLSVAVRNDGVHRVCCHSNVSEERGVLRDTEGVIQRADRHHLSDTRNSDFLKKIRLQMLAGEWPEACGRCQKEEALGLRSKRIYASEYLQRAEAVYLDSTRSDGSIDVEQWALEDLDLRFGNKCNLKCRMCGPSDSNAWYGDFEALTGKSFQAEGNFSWYQDQRFWDELFDQAANLRHIYLVGGEPLLIRQHFEFLKRLVVGGRASQVVLEYNTNLTVLPDEVIEIWRDFKEVKIGVSIDGYGELNNYIRHPSQFRQIEANLRKLDMAPIQLTAWIATTLSIYNFLDLNDLIMWKLRLQLERVGRSKLKPLVTPHFLHKPSHLSLKSLPEEIKSRVQKKIPSLRSEFEMGLLELSLSDLERESYLKQWNQIHQAILSFMQNSGSDSEFTRFETWNRDLDRIRAQSLRQIASPHFLDVFTGYV